MRTYWMAHGGSTHWSAVAYMGKKSKPERLDVCMCVCVCVCVCECCIHLKAFLVVLVVKNLPVNAGDTSLIPVLGRSPGEGNGNALQFSCLENPMDRGAWWATFHGVTKVLDTI